jgi:TonB family protein
MSPIFELEEELVATHEAPRLLVNWSSRWEEFVGSIKPAFARSEARLAGEAPFGLVPFRIMIPSYVIEAVVIIAAILIRVKVDELRPYVVPRIASHDVIYYSGDELPRTEDLGGAESGRTGEVGGQEAHHRTQTIKVARGGSLAPQVVDAPNLKLPSTLGAVANLLAIKPNPGPPPAEGMRSTRQAPNLVTTLAAPAPYVVHDYTRNGIRLDPVIAPAPSVSRDRALTAPSFNPTLLPPAPNIASDHTLVAPALAPVVVPPSPIVSRDHPLTTPTLDPTVAPPSPNVGRDPFRAAPALNATVAPPAPTAVSRQPSAAPVQAMDPAVVPPPVSAPERANVPNSKLSLPSPAVVAPPPSTDFSTDMRRLSPGAAPDPGKSVVPPPPSPSASGSFVGSLLGRIFGPSEQVAPPPTSVNSTNAGGASHPTLTANVAPPPATDPSGNTHGNRTGAGTTLGSNVAPPPSTGLTGGTGTSQRSAAPYLGNPSVVPPPPSLAGNGGGTGKTGGSNGAPGGRLLAEVTPPPPLIGGGNASTGSGLARKGPGLGAPLDPGSASTPATTGGSGKESGTVMSTQPGTKIGLPANATTGSLAMSPAGSNKAGLGGSGDGKGILHGNGPGSGMNGTGSGAGNNGTAHGSDPNARGGISPANGPGGAGNALSGAPPVPGVSISGGSTNVVNLDSFGPGPAGGDPSAPSRSASRQKKGTLEADVVGGSPFEAYKKYLGGEAHTTYFDTIIGTVAMLYSDQSETHGFRVALAAPSALESDLPDGLPKARLVIACTLDAEGNIKNPRVLEAGPAQMTAKVLAALRNWKFQPAMRNNQPVEVTAILGFGIDTNDRF